MVGLTGSKPNLIVHSAEPLNAEPPLDRLRSSFVTRVEDFYVRSHGDLPDLDPDRHTVDVTGLVATPLTLSVADLRARFTIRTVVAVMQCAGNRRADMQQVRPTTGDPWAAGAIGNAEWTGVSLAEVLREAGAGTDASLHVSFEAADIAQNEGAPDAPYGVSIPMAKALGADVLLAWAMNGAPLTRKHGAPLRVVVPGYAGVRSPKWLKRITVQNQPSYAFQQAQDYLLFPPAARNETRSDFQGFTITEMPVTSAICQPRVGASLPAGRAQVRGYAVATDRAIVRVDVSPNGGCDWVQAVIEDHGKERWSWTLWHVTLDLPKGEHELTVRAWDAAGQTQPAEPDETWNFKGYLGASWHRIRVQAS